VGHSRINREGPPSLEALLYYFLRSLRLYAFCLFAILATVLAKVVICALIAATNVATSVVRASTTSVAALEASRELLVRTLRLA